MALTDERALGSLPEAFTPLPEPRTLAGPRSRARMRRTFAVVAAVWALGLLVEVLDISPSATAAGLGLMLPGGGQLYTGHWVWAAVAFVGFLLAFVVFWLLSPLWLPVAVWLGSAGLAAMYADGTGHEWTRVGVPAALAAVLVASVVARLAAFRAVRREVGVRNAHLAGRSWVPPVRDGAPPLSAPLSDEDLAYQRYALDLLLQPLDTFDGFATVDQFREAAWRYQLNTAGWALALARYTTTPAFSGYVEEAQRNSIEKMLHPKVWSYWRWENLIGNLRWEPDPIRRDNVMLSGFFAAHLGAFEAVSGDTRFSETGALNFTDGSHTYRYDYPAIVGRLIENFRSAPLAMFPCEPNWVYPHCNELAMTGMVMFDRLHGTNHTDPLRAEFDRVVLQEFATPDDRVLNMRSSRLGISVPGLAKSTLTEADAVWLLSPLMPEAAARRWELVRRWFTIRDGRLHIAKLGAFDRVDVGNYQMPSLVFMLATILLAAREMGDGEIYAATKAAIDADYRPTLRNGAMHIDASPFTAMLATMGRLSRRHAWYDLTNRSLPLAWRTGPRLSQAPYPEVLVAQAISDGRDLDLELVPGAGGGRFDLVVDRLVPSARYRVDAGPHDTLTADPTGQGVLTVELAGRRRIRLSPIT
jgi:hypothetical protein